MMDVRLVPDGRDHGRRRVHRIGHLAFVEGRRSSGTTPSGDEDRIHTEFTPSRIDATDGLRHLRDGIVALHPHIHDQQGDRGASFASGPDDVGQGGGGSGRDDGDAARQQRERLLSLLVEPARRPQLGAQRLVAGPQCTGAGGTESFDDELRPPLRCVVGDVTGDLDLIPVGGNRLDAAGPGGSHDASDEGLLVLQGEVPVATRGQVADLLHAQGREGSEARRCSSVLETVSGSPAGGFRRGRDVDSSGFQPRGACHADILRQRAAAGTL